MVDRRVLTLLQQLMQQGIGDERVLKALAEVPREKFIDEAMSHKAYDNTALPIGLGQTISQPYMVARMTELLRVGPEAKVLEIGTGSGYQTAVLAHLVQHVFSVERIKSLQWQAKDASSSWIYTMFQRVTVTAGRAGRRVGRLMRLL